MSLCLDTEGKFNAKRVCINYKKMNYINLSNKSYIKIYINTIMQINVSIDIKYIKVSMKEKKSI